MLASNGYDVLVNVTTGGGIALCIGIIGFIVYACMALSQDKPVLPWGTHKRVSSAQARTKVAKEELAQERLEIERIALEPTRRKVLAAIESGEPIPDKKVGDEMREKHFEQSNLPMIPYKPEIYDSIPYNYDGARWHVPLGR